MGLTTAEARQVYDAENELTVFFCRHVSIFEKSTTGPMLERAAQFGQDENCRLLDTPAQQSAKEWAYNSAVARACGGGNGSVQEPDYWSEYWLNADDPSITAALTGGHDSMEAHFEPDDSDLMKFARVSRRMSRLKQSEQKALEALYGPCGWKWDNAGGKRDPAVYELTSSGKRILGKYCTDTLGTVAKDEILVHQVNQQKRWPEEARRQLIEAMEKQARNIHAGAIAAYLKTRTVLAAA